MFPKIVPYQTNTHFSSNVNKSYLLGLSHLQPISYCHILTPSISHHPSDSLRPFYGACITIEVRYDLNRPNLNTTLCIAAACSGIKTNHIRTSQTRTLQHFKLLSTNVNALSVVKITSESVSLLYHITIMICARWKADIDGCTR